MRRRTGFTFIELLTVVLFLAILAAMAIPRFREFKTRAYLASMQNDLGNLRIAQEEYWAQHQVYSTDTTGMGVRITSHVNVTLSSADVIGGYTAIATHANVPGQQCITGMGAEAAPREPGSIVCGPTSSSMSTTP
jgi:Tfp pilus assembly protein PilE